MNLRASMCALLALVLAGICCLPLQPAAAQGRTDYLNVESPQVHPIEVFSFRGGTYLAVCNTPNNTVEIWDTDEGLPLEHRLVATVRTGLEPVTVRWNQRFKRLYTANFLGDSISVIQVSSSRGRSLEAQLLRTVRVTDEPLDIDFAPGPWGNQLVVSHSMLDAYGIYDADLVQPVAAGSELLYPLVPAGFDVDGLGGPDDFALKDPRALAVRCGHLFIASMKGGNTELYDFDIYRRNLDSGAVVRWEGLGTSLFDMTFSLTGDMLLVGQQARNGELRDEPAVRDADTGFTRNVLHVIQDPCGEEPTVLTRDLNAVEAEGLSGALIYPVSSRGFALETATLPVAKSEALAQPTGVVAFRYRGATKAFVAAFASDRVGVIDLDPSSPPSSWARRTIEIGVAPGSDNPMAGPRAMALKRLPRRGVGPRLYVLNRLDNSVTVIDPVAESVVETFALSADPTPEYIRHGREFLYSAKLSGNGFVSCASCHIDGRTDGLGWDLGDPPGTPPQPLPPILVDDFQIDLDFFPVDKSWMVTQSLQGLLNFEVDQDSQGLFTNAPYHWRGDREDFVSFNVAFPGLLGGQLLADADMRAFEEMINSIHYPPNPKQPLDRGFTGELGDVHDLSTGNGALLGMKLYHQVNSDGFAACAHCHTLPSGSNNRITEEPIAKGGQVPDLFEPPQPVETPGLRGMYQKEARLSVDDPLDPTHVAISGLDGMTHTGFISPPSLPALNDFASIDSFMRALFAPPFCDDFFVTCGDLQALLSFVLQLDWGVAPTVGYSLTVKSANATTPGVAAQLDLLELEARRAHTGVVVQAWVRGGERGFWFDATALPTPYRDVASGATYDRAGLLGKLRSHRDRAVFLGVPLGDERRIASLSGPPAPLAGPAPSQLALLPAAPRESLEPIPSMVTMWRDPFDPDIFLDFGARLAHTIRVFQGGLIQEVPDAFGLAGQQWDVARRFRVAGADIRHGAELHLYTQDDELAGTPPNTALGPDSPGQVQLRRTTLPLYATDQRTPSGDVIWETAVEAEPEILYVLMLGGLNAPGVQAAYQDGDFNIPETPAPAGLFDPLGWNWHYLRVANADGTSGDGGWVRVTLD